MSVLKDSPSVIDAMMDPGKYEMLPLLQDHCTDPRMAKAYDFVLDFDINDASLTGEMVPTSSGFILWLVNRAVTFIRYGVIPSKAVSNYNTNGNLLVMLLPFGSSGIGAQLTYNAATPVPYALSYEIATTNDQVSVTPQQQIKSPSIINDFYTMRAVAGKASLKCDSAPLASDPNGPMATSTFNLRMATGNFRNVWDIFYTRHYGDQQNPVSCVDPNDVAALSFPQQDGMCDVLGTDGVCALQMTDILPRLYPSNPDLTDEYSPGNEQTVLGTGFVGADALITVLNPAVILAVAWVTPYDVTYSDTNQPNPTYNPNGIVVQNIMVSGGVDPTGVIDTDVNFCIFQNTTAQVFFYVQCCHVYVACLPTGQLIYDTAIEVLPVSVINQATDLNLFSGYAEIRPNKYHKGVAFAQCASAAEPYLPAPTGYMYLGTQLVTYMQGFRTTIGGAMGLRTLQYTCRARSFYATGSIGPARILAYYGASNGQSLHFRATVHIEGTPTGNLLAFARREKGTQSYFSATDSIINMANYIRMTNLPDVRTVHRCWNFREYTYNRKPTRDELEQAHGKTGVRVPVNLNQESDLQTTDRYGAGPISMSMALRGTDEITRRFKRRLQPYGEEELGSNRWTAYM